MSRVARVGSRPHGLTNYELADGVATITLDDGKVNALSPAMTGEIKERLDQAEADEAVVLMTGRETTLTAGFDLRVEPEGWREMLIGGAEVAHRLMSFPCPTVIACNGNAIAMGGFLLLAADHRVGAEGEFKIGLNEVAIGMTIPWFGIELARHRLTPPYFDRCTVTGMFLGPDEAREAGFLDEVVAPEALMDTARERAATLAGVNFDAHKATKLRVRARRSRASRTGSTGSAARAASGESSARSPRGAPGRSSGPSGPPTR